MSAEDIKENWTEYKIDGNVYKFAYRHSAIGELMELFDRNSIITLTEKIQELPNGHIDDLIDFCYLGLLKYHPEVKREVIEDYAFYLDLFNYCLVEYIKSVRSPDEWDAIVHAEKETKELKKKILAPKKSIISRLLNFIGLQ